MKAIYFGFKPVLNASTGKADSQPASMCSALLKWHALVLEKGGVGTIVRAIHERVPYPPGFQPPEEEGLDDAD